MAIDINNIIIDDERIVEIFNEFFFINPVTGKIEHPFSLALTPASHLDDLKLKKKTKVIKDDVKSEFESAKITSDVKSHLYFLLIRQILEAVKTEILPQLIQEINNNT